MHFHLFQLLSFYPFQYHKLLLCTFRLMTNTIVETKGIHNFQVLSKMFMNRHLNFPNMIFMRIHFISFDHFHLIFMSWILRSVSYFILSHKSNLTLMSPLMISTVKLDLDTFFVTILTYFLQMLEIICTKFSKRHLSLSL